MTHLHYLILHLTALIFSLLIFLIVDVSLLHLSNLNLKGNPITQQENYKEKILDLVPSLKVLDGERFDKKFLERHINVKNINTRSNKKLSKSIIKKEQDEIIEISDDEENKNIEEINEKTKRKPTKLNNKKNEV
ncbi:hypothetical protein BCR32DRAFT_288417 [Anaeromyces robustus]|uniref:Uncharacterized protein n=1 Tax=Anaeromyces robustus TaxID=1754192 RepID=A0A1Y1UXY5_9FUNG|nr:hypothetical protein BCR32DRAFT_288417 [Anaeromyces robustus]|eukprot:ORX42107.1 hypothetical protein BCR32DRAFT_288417 [Anaeromyces robustus]